MLPPRLGALAALFACLRAAAAFHAPFVVGINTYSHDVSAALYDARDGALVCAVEKERITRKKHAGGAHHEVVAALLERAGVAAADVGLVVRNNHHHRVAPFEARLPFACAQGHYPDECVGSLPRPVFLHCSLLHRPLTPVPPPHPPDTCRRSTRSATPPRWSSRTTWRTRGRPRPSPGRTSRSCSSWTGWASTCAP